MYTYLFLFSFLLICLFGGISTHIKWWRYFILSVGIVVGVLTIAIKHLAGETFAASTPVKLSVTNKSSEDVRLYVITVSDPKWTATPMKIYAGKRVKVNKEISLEFENDSTVEFWVVASNIQDEIKYLEVFDSRESRIEIILKGNTNVHLEKQQKAKELIKVKNKALFKKSILKWCNIGLIMLLFLNFFRN